MKYKFWNGINRDTLYYSNIIKHDMYPRTILSYIVMNDPLISFYKVYKYSSTYLVYNTNVVIGSLIKNETEI